MIANWFRSLWPRRRRGVIVFPASSWDAPATSPVARFIGHVRKAVKVVDTERIDGYVRVTCECDDFELVTAGSAVPQYMPSVSMRNSPDGETVEVTFRRRK